MYQITLFKQLVALLSMVFKLTLELTFSKDSIALEQSPFLIFRSACLWRLSVKPYFLSNVFLTFNVFFQKSPTLMLNTHTDRCVLIASYRRRRNERSVDPPQTSTPCIWVSQDLQRCFSYERLTQTRYWTFQTSQATPLLIAMLQSHCLQTTANSYSYVSLCRHDNRII